MVGVRFPLSLKFRNSAGLCVVTKTGSSYVWWGGGELLSHSMLVVVISGVVVFRLEENASHTMNISRITAVREIKDPIDDIRFQMVYASG